MAFPFIEYGQIVHQWLFIRHRFMAEYYLLKRSDRLTIDHNELEIPALLRENPFHSTRSLAHTLKIDHATVIRHIEQWIPHLLGPRLTEKLIQLAVNYCQYLKKERRTVGII
jgi:predicted HTH transcriptional regulator